MAQQIGNSALLRTWANNGTVVVPDNTKIDEGWLRGEQPPHEWMNYIHNVLGQKINHMLARGVPDWNTTTTFNAGAAVNHTGSLWVALSTNTNSEPSGANTDWSQVADASDISQILSQAGFVTEDGFQTLTNKTIAFGDNTLTDVAGTTAEQTLTNKTIAFGDNTLTDVAGTTAEQTLTNKTIAFGDNTLTGVAPSANPELTGAIYVNGSYRGNLVAVPALNIDCSLGNYFTKSISANSTFTFSNVPSDRSYAFTLRVAVSGDRTITWPASVEFPSDEAPTLTEDKTHIFVFVTDDGGTTFRGAFLANYEA